MPKGICFWNLLMFYHLIAFSSRKEEVFNYFEKYSPCELDVKIFDAWTIQSLFSGLCVLFLEGCEDRVHGAVLEIVKNHSFVD